jgi:hypothetical protein
MYAVHKREKKGRKNMKKRYKTEDKKTMFWQNSSSCSFDLEGIV